MPNGVTGVTLTLTANGIPVTLLPSPSNGGGTVGGTATLTYSTAGPITLLATATDRAGNAGTATATMTVIDPSVTQAPVATIASPTTGTDVNAPVPVVGTVSDPQNSLQSWTLSIAPNNSDFLPDGISPAQNNAPKVIATGTSAVTNGTLGTLDTTLLQNGSYTLTLTAVNAGGLTTSSSVSVEVSGNLKLGALNLSFTDMTVPAAGIPITITRTYSSLGASSQGDFGYGWTLSMSNTKVQVKHLNDTVSGFGDYVPFRNGDRVIITLPNGKKEGFTFEAVPGTALGGDSGTIAVLDYQPTFVPDHNVPDQLTVTRPACSKSGMSTSAKQRAIPTIRLSPSSAAPTRCKCIMALSF